MTTNESLCCDQEHALLLKETGLMEGVEADDTFIMWEDSYDLKESVPKQWILDSLNKDSKMVNAGWLPCGETIKTYRLDKILAKLPEWANYGYLHKLITGAVTTDIMIPKNLMPQISNLMKLIISHGGQQLAANAAAKLLHLLWKEGLVGGKPPKEGLV